MNGWVAVIAGVGIIIAGVIMNFSQSGVFWYGCYIVGPIWIIRGVATLESAPGTFNPAQAALATHVTDIAVLLAKADGPPSAARIAAIHKALTRKCGGGISLNFFKARIGQPSQGPDDFIAAMAAFHAEAERNGAPPEPPPIKHILLRSVITLAKADGPPSACVASFVASYADILRPLPPDAEKLLADKIAPARLQPA